MGCVTDKPQRPPVMETDHSHVSGRRSVIKKVHTYDKAKSKIYFSGNDMQPQTLKNPEKWVPTQAVQIRDRPDYNRDEDYGFQNYNASKSNLKSEKQILTYDIDTNDGVSKTPQINTFEYESILNHNLAVGQIGASKIQSKILATKINESKLKRTSKVNTSNVRNI